MNHIIELAIQRDGLSAELKAYHEAIEDLRSYLLSEKFHVDTTVQVKDVLSRLHTAVENALFAREEHDRVAYSNARKAEALRNSRPNGNCEAEDCSYFGRNLEVAAHHNGYSLLLCKKCYSAMRAKGEVD